MSDRRRPNPPLEEPTELDPLYEAVGRFIYASRIVELWLEILTSRTRPDTTMHQAHKMKPGGRRGYLVHLQGVATRLPLALGDELRLALELAGDVFELRQQAVHGAWAQTGDPEVMVSIRPSLSQVAPDGIPESIRAPLTRRRLLDGREDAHQVMGLVQSRMQVWLDALEPKAD